MSLCQDTCKKPSGMRMEHCKVSGCHQTFGGHTMADAHRVSAGSYVLAAPTLKGKDERFPTEAAVPSGWVVHSIANEMYRCLSVEEMLAKGWRDDEGVWKGPKLEGEGWWVDHSDPIRDSHGEVDSLDKGETLKDDTTQPVITEPEQDPLDIDEDAQWA